MIHREDDRQLEIEKERENEKCGDMDQ